VSSRFEILDTPIMGLRILERRPIGDSRGYMERMFCTEDLQAVLPAAKGIVQINRSVTHKRGIIRGLHFQYPPYAETKFVSCLRGEVFDVAVDLRRGSPTFLNWHAEILTADNHRTLVVPEGFAHGFQTLTEDCEILYFTTAAYWPSAENGLNALDPRLNILWPTELTEISPRDGARPLVTEEFVGVAL
jgi:dTDP-4-dehydrorhamnose 3,5-epimerase